MKRKPVEAWVILDDEGRIDDWDEQRPDLESHWGKRAVHLTEQSPADARRQRDERVVVRAAVRLADAYHEADFDSVTAEIELFKIAVSRLKRGGKP